MKAALAVLLAAVAATAVAPPPARAESSYWEQRWQSKEATPEDGRGFYRDRRRHEARRLDRRRADRPARTAEIVPNPFRVEQSDGLAWPTLTNNYAFQESIYDFQDGKAADIKQYRY